MRLRRDRNRGLRRERRGPGLARQAVLDVLAKAPKLVGELAILVLQILDLSGRAAQRRLQAVNPQRERAGLALRVARDVARRPVVVLRRRAAQGKRRSQHACAEKARNAARLHVIPPSKLQNPGLA